MLRSTFFYSAVMLTSVMFLGLTRSLSAQCSQRITQEFKGELLVGATLQEVPLAAALLGYAVGVCENNPLNPENFLPCTSLFSFQAGNWTLMGDAMAVSERWKACAEELDKIVHGLSPIPDNISTPLNVGCDIEYKFEIGHIEARSGLYQFAIGNVTLGKKITGTINYCDQIIMTNATDQVKNIEFPIHSVGSVYAAESFGVPGNTWGKVKVVVDGSVAGSAIHDSASVESITVIPELGYLNKHSRIPITLPPGNTIINVNLAFRVEVETRASGSGPLCGSATAGFNAPGSISIGNLSGPSGSPLPEGLLIYSGVDSTLYADTRILGACCLGDSCVVLERTACQAAGGFYLGQNSQCRDSTCTSSTGPLTIHKSGYKSELFLSGAPFHALSAAAIACDRKLYVTNSRLMSPFPSRLYEIDLSTKSIIDITGATILDIPLSLLLGSGKAPQGNDLILSDENAYSDEGRVYRISRSTYGASVMSTGTPQPGTFSDDPAGIDESPGGILGEGLYVIDAAGISLNDPMLFRINPDLSTTVLIQNNPNWPGSNTLPFKICFGEGPGFAGNLWIADAGTYRSGTEGRRIWKWNPSDGLTEFISPGVFGDPWSIAFSTPGPFENYMYVFDAKAGTISQVDTNGTSSVFVQGMPTTITPNEITFSPDGSELFAVVNDAIYRIWSKAAPPQQLDPNSMSFVAEIGGVIPGVQHVAHRIVSVGCEWQASVDQPWVQVSPTSGYYDDDTIFVSVTTTDLPIGMHEATITISSPNDSYEPLTLPVHYVIQVPVSLCRFVASEPLSQVMDSVAIALRDSSGSTLAERHLEASKVVAPDKSMLIFQAFTMPEPDDTMSANPIGFDFRLTPCGLEICRDTAAAFTIYIDGVEQQLYSTEEAAGCPECDSIGQPPVIICPVETLLVELDQPDTLKIPMAIANADRVLTSGSFWDNDTLFVPIPDDGRYALLPTAFNACGFSQCPIIIQARVGCGLRCGDFDGSCRVDLTDAVFLINYIFAGGPRPLPIENGDVNCDSRINITDAVYLVNYIFASGPLPCAACP